MSTNFRQVRLFLSSTFRDMNEERDYLNKYVFPKSGEAHFSEKWGNIICFLHFSTLEPKYGVGKEEIRGYILQKLKA